MSGLMQIIISFNYLKHVAYQALAARDLCRALMLDLIPAGKKMSQLIAASCIDY